jgi:hypothetical protein
MHLAEVVSANEDCERVAVIVERLGISEGESGEPFIEVANAQILAFNMRRANPIFAWIACFNPDRYADEWSG